MSYMSRYLLADTIVFIWTFFGIRMFMDSIIAHLYNTSSRKKLRKGQNFVEWFTFSRFKQRLPKRIYLMYYSIFVLYLIDIVLIIILCQIELTTIAQYIARGYYIIAHWPYVYYLLKTSGHGFSREIHMDEFVQKKHGNKKGK
jgi:hypothetical protein